MNNFRQKERAYSVILLWNNYLRIFFLVLRNYMYNLPENSILKDFNLQSVTMTIRKFRMTCLIILMYACTLLMLYYKKLMNNRLK